VLAAVGRCDLSRLLALPISVDTIFLSLPTEDPHET